VVPGRSIGGRTAAWAVGAALFSLGLSCSRRIEEPSPPPLPSTSPSARASGSAAPLDPRERKEIAIRLFHEACQEPVKQINRLNGRKETDPAGIDVLSLCIDRGNVAWSRCVMAAKTKADVDTCASRFLIDPPK
jgi:hypothetical protein